MAAKSRVVQVGGETKSVALGAYAVTKLSKEHLLVSIDNRLTEVFSSDRGVGDGVFFDQIEIQIPTAREQLVHDRFASNTSISSKESSATVTLKAPMPGLVRSLLVKVGDSVERTTTVIVLEAMKMENNILAGVKGRITKIYAETGASVEKGAKLIEIERL